MSTAWDWLTPSVLTLAGTYVATSANNKAANTAGAATLQGAQITADAIREGNAAIIAGNTQAQKTLDQMRQQGAPAVGYLRETMANPGGLTPEQQAQLDELHRDTSNAMHSTSFAGSGRTGVSLLRKTETDFRNRALGANIGRADDAARTLYGTTTGATTGIAASQAGTGTQIAAGDQAIGKVSGDAVAKSGLYDAQAGIANGNLMGRAIGDIGSQIANEGRESRYADRLSAIEKSLKPSSSSSNNNWLTG
jgi:hypothetical protein